MEETIQAKLAYFKKEQRYYNRLKLKPPVVDYFDLVQALKHLHLGRKVWGFKNEDDVLHPCHIMMPEDYKDYVFGDISKVKNRCLVYFTNECARFCLFDEWELVCRDHVSKRQVDEAVKSLEKDIAEIPYGGATEAGKAGRSK